MKTIVGIILISEALLCNVKNTTDQKDLTKEEQIKRVLIMLERKHRKPPVINRSREWLRSKL